MEGCRTLAAKQKDFVIRDLVGKTHVGRHPVGLVDLGSANLLPHVPRDVINFDRVDNALLIYSSTESENVVVLKHCE